MLERLRRPLTPERYRRITMGALVLLVVIVVTGAGVRLTGSGLGCSDWPGCTDTTFVAPMELNPMIEFVNRLITGAVSAAVGLAVLGSLRRVPRRRDLTWLSLGLVAGVVGQILLGALVVWSHLNPWLVQGHFVLSAVLITNAVVLTHRAGLPDDRVVRPVVTPALLGWGRILVAAAAAVILTGTLVTGSGPHSGHNEGDPFAVRRLPIEVTDAARLHGISMIVFLAATVWVLVELRRHRVGEPLQRAGSALLTVLILQGALGYTQYLTGVPPLLVGLHVLGSTLVLVAVLNLLLRMQLSLESGAAGPRDSEGEPSADHLPRGDLLTHR
jgi:cytochrome c oxidase assembly protein subunit 15